ncbi:MAG: tRNA (5-methylaminomethyl-2-thiouridylate)-methyltransferase [Gammaproteobacteria bacterium]|nr:tRNA (5-methylaminomethyl-2-thiouridylate)-methyltransferase [Gammaproteobacteria bacterium]
MSEQPRAVALISGGLDSMLAARVVMDQGVHVEGVNFFTGFCVEGHTHAIREHKGPKPKRNNALWVAEQLGIPLHLIDVIEEYKDVLLNPKHGYGANMNPCLDCKIFMVKKARELFIESSFLSDHGFDFIITGEVVGQRPKSQRKWTMPVIASESGANDRLLRPLSAHNLPETLPEREGWVQRDKLFGFSGRDRKPQIALAKSLGFEDWAQPAGGCCFLTDANYSNKLVDLWKSRGNREYELDDIILLKVGRHLRPAPHFKLIIGREQGENEYLRGYAYALPSIECLSHIGPLCLIDGDPSDADLELAAALVARYSQGRDVESVTVEVRFPNKTGRVIHVRPVAAEDIAADWWV